MFRTTLLLIALCALGACDTPSRTTAPNTQPTVYDPTPRTPRQGIRGILRRVGDESVSGGWALEVGGGEVYTLVGGPVETYESLVDKEVFIMGTIQSGTIMVDTCDQDSRLIPEFNRRLGGRT